MIASFRNNLRQHLWNSLGFKTKRKIILFESDDWGSIRIPSQGVYAAILEKGIRLDNLSYNRYDSLATGEDLAALFQELNSIKDFNGQPVVFTANTVVTNPDFQKIIESNFTDYKYELFTDTLKKYPHHQNSFNIWKEGIEAKVFKPQFHGREHLNVTRWMNDLKGNIGHAKLAFDFQMFDLSTSLVPTESSYMEALDYNDSDELEFHKASIIEGTDIFEEIFGYRSTSFIAPCYIWSSDLNEILLDCGIYTIQGGFYQFQPYGSKRRKIIHFTGQKNKLGQCYLVRNVSFEPSENASDDWIGSALSQIANAFRWETPAIISSHRMNYIGHIVPQNRDRNLILLRQLLKAIISRWPEVEFMSSDQLGYLIQSRRD